MSPKKSRSKSHEPRRALPKTKWGGPRERSALGKRIEAFLKATDATPTELAAAVGCSERQVRYWRRGTFYPYPAQKERLEKVLDAGRLPWQESRDRDLAGVAAR